MASFGRQYRESPKMTEDHRQLHLRQSYQRLRDLSDQFEKEIEEMERQFLKACQRVQVKADITRERPTDASWQHYGLLPFSLWEDEHDVEEEFDWLVRDIRTWASNSIPRSSTLSITMRAFDTEGIGQANGAHLFYKILRANNMFVAPH